MKRINYQDVITLDKKPLCEVRKNLVFRQLIFQKKKLGKRFKYIITTFYFTLLFVFFVLIYFF